MAKNLKNLDKLIELEDELYQINAEQASHVENTLTIESYGYTGQARSTETVNYDGSIPKTVSIVSATSGGRFNKPIHVPNHNYDERSNINNEEILNYSDILNIVFKEFKNYSALYSWNQDGTTEANKFHVVLSGDTPHGITIVQGRESHLQSFDVKNQEKRYLSVYLYICSDTGNLFYGTGPEVTPKIEPVKLARASDWATESGALTFTDGSNEDPYTAELIKNNIETKLNNIVNGGIEVPKAKNAINLVSATNANSYYDYEDLKNIINTLNDRIQNNTEDIKETQETLIPGIKSELNNTINNKNTELNRLISNNTKAIEENQAKIKDNTNEIVSNTNNITINTSNISKNTRNISKIIDGDTKVSAATKADSATNADNATKADSATSASRDGTNTIISKNYYRTHLNTDEVNYIYIQTGEPSGAKNGDIWIKY